MATVQPPGQCTSGCAHDRAYMDLCSAGAGTAAARATREMARSSGLCGIAPCGICKDSLANTLRSRTKYPAREECEMILDLRRGWPRGRDRIECPESCTHALFQGVRSRPCSRRGFERHGRKRHRMRVEGRGAGLLIVQPHADGRIRDRAGESLACQTEERHFTWLRRWLDDDRRQAPTGAERIPAVRAERPQPSHIADGWPTRSRIQALRMQRRARAPGQRAGWPRGCAVFQRQHLLRRRWRSGVQL